MLVALALGVVVHLGLAYAVWSSPAPKPDDPNRLPRVQVSTFVREVRLERDPLKSPEPPKPPPPKKIEPLKREVQKPPETLKKLEKLEKKQVAKAAPKRIPRVKKKARKKTAGQKKPKPTGPKTLVLPNLGGNSRMKIAEGDEQVLGNPEVPVTPESSTPDEGPSGDGPADSDGAAPSAGPAAPAPSPKKPPKLIPPRVRKKVRGVYPDNAPRTGRTISLTLTVKVGTDGRVNSARIVSKPRVAGTFFDAEALRVARRTLFRPASRDGVPIEHRISYVVVFEP